MLSFIAVKINEKGSNCPLWNETVDDHQQIDGPTKTVRGEEEGPKAKANTNPVSFIICQLHKD